MLPILYYVLASSCIYKRNSVEMGSFMFCSFSRFSFNQLHYIILIARIDMHSQSMKKVPFYSVVDTQISCACFFLPILYYAVRDKGMEKRGREYWILRIITGTIFTTKLELPLKNSYNSLSFSLMKIVSMQNEISKKKKKTKK